MINWEDIHYKKIINKLKTIMLWITTKRIFKSGLQNFSRNGFVSISSVLIMMITLFIITTMIVFGGFLKFNLEKVKDKVDINVYFVTSAKEADILSLKKDLEALPEVSMIEYITKEQALANFEESNKSNDIVLQSIKELGDNPLGAVLNIKAKDSVQYEGIAKYLNNLSGETLSQGSLNIIDTVNYGKNKVIIDGLNKLIKIANMVGLWLAIMFIFISIVVTFNTIKLTIFMSRDEISVMRLVGASNEYVKGPFVVSGILCGAISAVLVLILYAILTFLLNRYYGYYFAGFNLNSFYLNNFLKIFGIIIGSGIILGAFSSYLAVRKYLRH